MKNMAAVFSDLSLFMLALNKMYFSFMTSPVADLIPFWILSRGRFIMLPFTDAPFGILSRGRFIMLPFTDAPFGILSRGRFIMLPFTDAPPTEGASVTHVKVEGSS